MNVRLAHPPAGPTQSQRLTTCATAFLTLGVLAGIAHGATGCRATQFPDEGPGQPKDSVSGLAPPGAIGACREPFSKRPPVVSAELWEHLRRCNKLTPSRYLRLGYGRVDATDPAADQRVNGLVEALGLGAGEKDGNQRMLAMMRTVQREAVGQEKLAARVVRSSGRTLACDYSYLFNTTDKALRAAEGGCPVKVFDPELKAERCLFDDTQKEARWLTSAWSCLGFTDTVGEGGSCYRACAYDDYCAAQVSCSAADFDLALCALGVCGPEKVDGIL
ncbi:MAG: hypothetical protein EXR75_14895 [Myxococcales bacterium]|nr:hypothetical protein [Myxococcales bacterium]